MAVALSLAAWKTGAHARTFVATMAIVTLSNSSK
jgi:hypothetical protein